MPRPARLRPRSALRRFLGSQAAGGLVLMAAAALSLLFANTALAPIQATALAVKLGPLSLLHWINDALMALFFLLVGLEIKRELLDGQLASWPRRTLPGLAAAGGMIVPAVIYLALHGGDAAAARGWAIPTATDIAFALGVLVLLGERVPPSLRIFLTALAILDDLGAVAIIALFYAAGLSLPDLLGAAGVLLLLLAMNRMGVLRLWPYLLVGLALWMLVLRSGIHATIAGVLLALAIPLRVTPGGVDDTASSPLHRLEHALQPWVAFLILPVFGFANAGVSLAGIGFGALLQGIGPGIILGLVAGKFVGVLGAALLAIRLGLADVPMGATRAQLAGVALLCGIGFTMSLFVALLAFPDSAPQQDQAKRGILTGSLIAGLAGYAVLRIAPRERPALGRAALRQM